MECQSLCLHKDIAAYPAMGKTQDEASFILESSLSEHKANGPMYLSESGSDFKAA